MSEIGSIDRPTYLKLLYEHAALKEENAQCKEAFAAVSAGKPMGPIVEKHLIQNMQKRIAELEAECNSLAHQLNQCNERGGRVKAENERLEAENERLRLALKRIAPTACPKCGDKAVQQIARDALRDIDAAMEDE